ncbi:hypothetical protein HanRHA438_Chr11g0530901 [Helianthus annuus]|nr:hypothetical protein HanRHA438_Chr11g0530901 [Helianthus annuus]
MNYAVLQLKKNKVNSLCNKKKIKVNRLISITGNNNKKKFKVNRLMSITCS